MECIWLDDALVVCNYIFSSYLCVSPKRRSRRQMRRPRRQMRLSRRQIRRSRRQMRRSRGQMRRPRRQLRRMVMRPIWWLNTSVSRHSSFNH